jgi:hypothetical protein
MKPRRLRGSGRDMEGEEEDEEDEEKRNSLVCRMVVSIYTPI